MYSNAVTPAATPSAQATPSVQVETPILTAPTPREKVRRDEIPGISCVLMTSAQQFLRDKNGSQHRQRSKR
jgi:hypothetical protein